MGLWGNIKKTANFYESAKTIICHLIGMDRKSAHTYISDHDDLFKAMIHQDVPVETSLMIVSNYLLKNFLDDTPHKSPLLAKYEHGTPRKYDLVFVTYQILNQDREAFRDILDQVDRKIEAANDLLASRPDIAKKLGISFE